MPKFPFEASLAEIEADPEPYIDSVFSCLESQFLLMPKGKGFVEYLDSERYLIEQCVSVVENGWGWQREQRHRTVPALVDLVVRTAGCGSNLLLNVGPDPQGVIPVEQVERMRALGAWMRRHGEAIYGTSAVRLAAFPRP